MLALLTLVAAVYLPVARLGFASDDLGLVVGNPYTADPANIPSFYIRGLWEGLDDGGAAFYRPTMLLGLTVDRVLWGLSPGPHHLHSLAWHLAAVAGLVALLGPVLGERRALAAGAIFGLHPVQTEVVAFVSARNDAMAVALCLGAAVVWTRAARSGVRAVLAAALLFLALGAKETALVAALGYAALALRPGTEDRTARLGLVGVCAAAFLALRWVAVGGALPPADGGWELLAARAPAVLGHYLALLWRPWPLSDAVTLVYLPEAVPWWAIALSVVAAGTCVRRGGAVAVLGLALAVAVFLPVLPVVASKKVLPDRYLYFPMAGLATAVAAALPTGRGALVAAGAACLPWSVLVGLRIPAWTDSLTLAESGARATPSGYSQGWLAIELARVGRVDEAREPLVAALTASPPYCPVGPLVVEAAERAPAQAVALGGEVYRHGCAGYPDFRETWAVAHLAAGDRRRAEAIMSPPPPCAPGLSVARLAYELGVRGRAAAEACAAASPDGPRLLRAAEARVALLPPAPNPE